MTPTEADDRIILSRSTLARFIQLTSAGIDPMPGTLVLVNDEIAILEDIGEQHPGKVAKLIWLVSDWLAFREGLKAKLH